MFRINIAARRHGTIELQSGVFERNDAIALIASTTRSSIFEARRIISEAGRLGMFRWREDNLEILARPLWDSEGFGHPGSTVKTTEQGI